jgi:signal transduction histidine kinase
MNGSGHVHVSVGSVTSRGRDFVEVAVSDDGPGISPDIIDRVFDPFVTGRPNIGTGLGLYLIQEYLYSVGGQVMVENSDPGATFRMRFQAAREVDARDGSLPRGSAEVVR